MWRAFQRAAHDEARSLGAEDPELWAEGESGLMVLDRAHPAYESGKGSVGQACIVINLGGKISGGAW